MVTEKSNAKDWAKTYTAKVIEQGVCKYEDETILIKNEALHQMADSFKGRPVLLMHDKVVPENMEEKAVGYVSECYFSAQSCSFMAKFIVFNEEAKQKIQNGWSVSCAYIPTKFGVGGTWHNIPYDREVLNGEYTHLAIVPDPRYEDAYIYENSKLKKENKNMILKFFEKKETNEVTDPNKTYVELENGKEMALSEMIEEVQKNQKENEKQTAKEDAEVQVGDEKMTVKELINKYKNLCKKENKNEDEDYDEEQGDVPGEQDTGPNEYKKEKKNEAPEKQNSQDFQKLKANRQKPAEEKANSILDSMPSMERGKARYGSNYKAN